MGIYLCEDAEVKQKIATSLAALAFDVLNEIITLLVRHVFRVSIVSLFFCVTLFQDGTDNTINKSARRMSDRLIKICSSDFWS